MNVLTARSFFSYIFGLLFFFSFCPLKAAQIPERAPIHFSIVTLSFNNESYYEQNLNSIFSQKYPHWKLYYVDDASTDGTYKAVVRKIRKSGYKKKCTVFHNRCNCGGTKNLYTVIKKLPPNSVVVLLDGDDAFSNENVLSRIALEYKKNNAWLTYGSYIHEPEGCRGTCSKPFPQNVLETNSFRSFPQWCTSHCKTFYAKLFQSIARKDLQNNGEFFRGGWDIIIMYPMLEMAGKDHIRFIPDILYIYRTNNPLSDALIHNDQQKDAWKWIHLQKPYQKLPYLFKQRK